MTEEIKIKNDIQVEADTAITDFEKLIATEIAYISTLTIHNLDELLKIIFENCGDISELDNYIEYLNQNIIQNRMISERMQIQKRLTKEDFIEENIFNIFGVYAASALGTYLFSGDPINFTKNFLIVMLIGITTFKINLDYFTGNYRKKQITDYLTKLDRSIEEASFYIEILKKMKAMCITELQYEVTKLYEIINDSNNYEIATIKLEELINGMGIATIVDSKNVKKLEKKN